MKPQHALMALALVASAWLALFGDKTPADQAAADVAGPVDRPARTGAPGQAAPVPVSPRSVSPSSAASSGAVTILRLRERAPYAPRRGQELPEAALFGSTSWNPPPPPVTAGPPPPPQAPPLPYSFIGKKQEDGAWEVYLAVGDDTRVVRAHSVLDGQYRIDAIRPPTLSLTYLPLQQVQTLNIGTAE